MLEPRQLISSGVVIGEFFTYLDNGRVRCDLCPRSCVLKDRQKAFCFVREAYEGKIVLSTYGQSMGFCVDPIEKKPLNHFFPGSGILSFGTAGCNLACRFCQNWDMSRAREVNRMREYASPEQIAQAAQKAKVTSVAFTYNDPIVFFEYAVDTAEACHAQNIKTVAVTAGYIQAPARMKFFKHMNAANVDLKSIRDSFYQKMCAANVQPVLDTLKFIQHETSTWLEITNLVIPNENDSHDDIAELCDWIVENIDPSVPVHFSAFHPDYKVTNKERTPASTLLRIRKQAIAAGLKYVYTGNVSDSTSQSTYCPFCQSLIIERNGYQLGQWHIKDGTCRYCLNPIAGYFTNEPGEWGAKRSPLRL